jgi:crotonobetainyl-CoA:carnitine CoA-transferase CaiB-like acyl-CoA transferase
MRHYRRLWRVLDRPEMIQEGHEARERERANEIAVLSEILLTRTADEWADFLQSHHIPAARVRTMGEALADEHTWQAAMSSITIPLHPALTAVWRCRSRPSNSPMAGRRSIRRR